MQQILSNQISQQKLWETSANYLFDFKNYQNQSNYAYIKAAKLAR